MDEPENDHPRIWLKWDSVKSIHDLRIQCGQWSLKIACINISLHWDIVKTEASFNFLTSNKSRPHRQTMSWNDHRMCIDKDANDLVFGISAQTSKTRNCYESRGNNSLLGKMHRNLSPPKEIRSSLVSNDSSGSWVCIPMFKKIGET